MKKNIINHSILASIGLGLVFSMLVARGQQFLPQTNSVVSFTSVTWKGANADVVAKQLFNITNADGSQIFLPGQFTNHLIVLTIRIEPGTNGFKSIRARMQ